tara:strand:- start:367 stop:615 length:249 start_codon:yes stop_codon:yes gene_type:complete
MKTITKNSHTCTECGNKKNSRHNAKQIFHIKTKCVRKSNFVFDKRHKIQDRFNCVYICKDCGGEKLFLEMTKKNMPKSEDEE